MSNILRCICFLVLCAVGCSSNHVVLDVAVEGLPSEVALLAVSLSQTGDSKPTVAREISSGLAHFKIELPESKFGLFTVQLTALDGANCGLAQGAGSVDVNAPGTYSVPVMLSALPAGICQLRVSLIGQGSGVVTSEPAGISCGQTCQATFPFGQPVTLTASADPSSLFFGWSGACSGTGPCKLASDQQSRDVRASFVTRDNCLVDGLCWQNPRPQGSNLLSIWGARPDRLWAVGSGGTILMWNGSFWAPSAHPPVAQLNGIWGSGVDDVWAVGNFGVILHWDGLAWQSWESPTTRALNAIHGTGPKDIWVVGNRGVILHWDGAVWAVRDAGSIQDLTAVWANEEDVWFTSYQGAVWRLHNGQFSSQSLASGALSTVWGTAADDVWVAGALNHAFHFDGTQWTALPEFDPPHDLSDLRFIRAIWGASRDEVWLGNTAQRIYRHRNGGFETLASTEGSVYSLFGFGSEDIWAVGGGGLIMHWNGVLWERLSSGITDMMTAVWGKSSSQMWAASSSGGLFQYDGYSWRERARSSAALYGIWGSADNDIWAVGANGAIFHYDGQRWSAVLSPTGATLGAIWGNSATDVWVGGLAGVLLHWDGTTWLRRSLPDNSLATAGIWGSGPSDVWVVGAKILSGGFVYHWNGLGWTDFSVPGLPELRAISGVSSSEVWAVGYDKANGIDVSANIIMHWDGSDWYVLLDSFLFPGSASYDAVWNAGPSDVWIAGDGHIWHIKEVGGERVDSVGARLSSIWGVPNGLTGTDIFLVGERGSILRWRR